MRAALTALGLIAAACAPLPRSEPLSPVRHNQPRLEEAIRNAQAAFDSAAQAGNISQMASLFTADGVLITRGNDTIHGRSAIAAYLVAGTGGATGARFWFAREPPLQSCRDGGFEHAQLTAEVRFADRTPDTVQTRLAVLWKRDATGAVRVQRAALSERDLDRGPAHAECVTETDIAVRLQESQRLSATLVVGFPIGSPAGDLRAAMIARGWTDTGYLCPPSKACADQPTPQSYSSPPFPVVPVLRYRFSASVAAHLLFGALPPGAVIGINIADSSQLGVSWSGGYGGVLFSSELAGVDIGIGPAVQTVHWHVDDRNWPYNASTVYGSSHQTTALGVVGGILRAQPMIGHVHLDALASIRWFGRQTVSGSPRFPPFSVAHNGVFFGLGLGLAF